METMGVICVFKKNRLQPFFKKCREGLGVIVLPLALFQLIRTIFLPTTLDVMLTALLFFIYIGFLKHWL
ncbi:hypothetical protein [Sporolactobacillus terrae]|uniref:hypothetical protein n=1 Tax=Sporolactobacillus terrae TaxID=269673 RepID=UPI000B1AFA88|nr:hypothetical protein [Sporolactobacillus terrae]